MAGRKRKPKTNLKEGEYPTRVPVETPDGDRYVIETTRLVPSAERPVAPIKTVLLSEHLLPLFDGLNVRGKTGIDAVILLARMGAHRYDTLRKFCIAWEDLHQPNLFYELYPELEFQEPTLEQCCDLAKVSYEDFVGDICRQAYYYGGEQARLKVHVGMPDVVEASYTNAVKGGARGFQDRQMLLKAGGVVQEGPGTIVNVNNTLNSATLVQGLPKWEETDKILTSILSPQKSLPAPSAAPVEIEVIENEPARSNNDPVSA